MLRQILALARPTQWIKNGVVLAALVFAGEASNLAKAEQAVLAMVIFCLLSSAVYAFNDLLDREKDRLHPLKKNRPIASGKVPVSVASAMIVVLMAVSLTGSWWLGRNFMIAAAAYLVLNGLYSIWLKNLVILDVMSIALGFVIRAFAGAVAINVPASKWLLVTTLFLALFLAFGKRRHELLLLEEDATSHRKSLDRYSPYLLDQCIGVTTAAVVVMYMLYTFSEEVSQRLGTNDLYFTIPFVVYGIFRYLYLIHKEEKGGSPTRVLITDRPILLTVVLWIMTVIVILYLV